MSKKQIKGGYKTVSSHVIQVSMAVVAAATFSTTVDLTPYITDTGTQAVLVKALKWMPVTLTGDAGGQEILLSDNANPSYLEAIIWDGYGDNKIATAAGLVVTMPSVRESFPFFDVGVTRDTSLVVKWTAHLSGTYTGNVNALVAFDVVALSTDQMLSLLS